jgi:hypothetical protein
MSVKAPNIAPMPMPQSLERANPGQKQIETHKVEAVAGELNGLLLGPVSKKEWTTEDGYRYMKPVADQMLQLPDKLSALAPDGSGKISGRDAMNIRDTLTSEVRKSVGAGGFVAGPIPRFDQAPASDRPGPASGVVPPEGGNANVAPDLLRFLAGRMVSDPDGMDRLRAMPESAKAKLAELLLGMLRSAPGQGGSGSLFGPQPIGAPGMAPKANPMPMIDAGGVKPDVSADAFVNLTESDALQLANRYGVGVRKEGGIGTMEVDNNRINLSIENGRVAKARFG